MAPLCQFGQVMGRKAWRRPNEVSAPFAAVFLESGSWNVCFVGIVRPDRVVTTRGTNLQLLEA